MSIPLGFIACWLGTVLTQETVAERSFDELLVRSETGLGAELGTGLTLTGRRAGSTGGGGGDHHDAAAASQTEGERGRRRAASVTAQVRCAMSLDVVRVPEGALG